MPCFDVSYSLDLMWQIDRDPKICLWYVSSISNETFPFFNKFFLWNFLKFTTNIRATFRGYIFCDECDSSACCQLQYIKHVRYVKGCVQIKSNGLQRNDCISFNRKFFDHRKQTAVFPKCRFGKKNQNVAQMAPYSLHES